MWLVLTQAEAYELRLSPDGEVVRWDTFPVRYAIAGGEPGLAPAGERAFGSWADARGSAVRFAAASPPSEPEVAPDAANVVFLNPDWPWGDALGMSSVWATETGEIVAFDIELNPDAAWSTTGEPEAYDLEAAVLHEIGHVLGIEHSAYPEATMYAEHGPGETWRRELHDDDLAAAAFLYPARDAAGASRDDAEPAPGPLASLLSGGNQCAHAPGLAPAALLLAPFLRRRRRVETR